MCLEIAFNISKYVCNVITEDEDLVGSAIVLLLAGATGCLKVHRSVGFM